MNRREDFKIVFQKREIKFELLTDCIRLLIAVHGGWRVFLLGPNQHHGDKYINACHGHHACKSDLRAFSALLIEIPRAIAKQQRANNGHDHGQVNSNHAHFVVALEQEAHDGQQ